MLKQKIKDRIEQIVLPVLDDLNFELVDLELRGHEKNLVLTIFIDKEGGVNLDDCAEVSHEVGTLLDVDDVVQNSYRLEVSSPGLERSLKKTADFIRFSGKLVKIRTRCKCDPDQSGQMRKTFRGKLLGLEKNQVRIKIESPKKNIVFFTLDDIEKANLELDF